MRERGWYWICIKGSILEAEVAEYYPPTHKWFLCASEEPLVESMVDVLSERLEPPKSAKPCTCGLPAGSPTLDHYLDCPALGR